MLKGILKAVVIFLVVVIGLTMIVGGDDEEPKVEEPKVVDTSNYDYTVFIGEQSSTLGTAFDDLNILMGNAQMDDQDWILQMAGVITTIELTAEETINYEPVPDKFKATHNETVGAMKEYKAAMAILPEAIDSQDPALLNQSTDYLIKAAEFMERAIAEMDKIEK